MDFVGSTLPNPNIPLKINSEKGKTEFQGETKIDFSIANDIGYEKLQNCTRFPVVGGPKSKKVVKNRKRKKLEKRNLKT